MRRARSVSRTRRSVAKRFKITGSGKIMRRSPGKRHLLSCKSPKRRRNLTKAKPVADGDYKRIMGCLPYSH